MNAILRRSARENIDLAFENEADRLSVETSHPAWLIERWRDEFGAEKAAEIAVANNEISEYAFRSLDGSPMVSGSARASEFVDGCYITSKIEGDPIAFAAQNKVYFQDEGSQMVAASVRVPDGGRLLDVCAAPGGKLGLIARRHALKTSTIVAGDLYRQRLDVLRDNCLHQGAKNVFIVQYDAEKGLPFADVSFDVVLIDAPCSGTGTIRHNPELRYFIKPSDIEEISRKQLAILGNASKIVKGGGSLLYSTCSLEIEENETVCREFLKVNADFEILKPNVPARFITNAGFARTFPHRDGMDGFFIAAFRRK